MVASHNSVAAYIGQATSSRESPRARRAERPELGARRDLNPWDVLFDRPLARPVQRYARPTAAPVSDTECSFVRARTCGEPSRQRGSRVLSHRPIGPPEVASCNRRIHRSSKTRTAGARARDREDLFCSPHGRASGPSACPEDGNDEENHNHPRSPSQENDDDEIDEQRREASHHPLGARSRALVAARERGCQHHAGHVRDAHGRTRPRMFSRRAGTRLTWCAWAARSCTAMTPPAGSRR